MARQRKTVSKTQKRGGEAPDREQAGLRIVGGLLRGRKLLYSGQERTRPMKDRVREAVFNLLGPAVKGKHAIDLFAGTGALGFEAISRGAERATFVEQHFPTADLVRQNAAALGVADHCQVQAGNAFIWAQKQIAPGNEPWVVFCSPPYAYYVDRQEEMLSLVRRLLDLAAPGSMFVVESDARFEPALLPRADAWDIRHYPPAVVAIYRN